MALTPIPQKTCVLEKSFAFMPKLRVEKIPKTQNNRHPEFKDVGDVSTPIMLATRQLFYYLAPLRAMRVNLNEDLLLFYMEAPTFGFCLKVSFAAALWTVKNIVTDNLNKLSPQEVEKLKEKTGSTSFRLL